MSVRVLGSVSNVFRETATTLVHARLSAISKTHWARRASNLNVYTIPGTWLDTVLSIPHGRAFPSLSLLLGFNISVNEHLNLLPGHFGGDRANIEGAQSMPVRRPRKTHYVGYVPSLAPSAIPISDLEFPSWEGNARSPHST